MKIRDNNTFQGMFLILAVAVSLAGKGLDKKSPEAQYLRSQSSKAAVTYDFDATMDLATQKRDVIKNKAEELLAKLDIQNLQDKSVEEQKQALYKIMKYIIYSTHHVASTDNQEKATTPSEQELDMLFQRLYTGNASNISTEAKTLTLLYNMCGIESEYLGFPKEYDKIPFEYGAVTVKLADGNRYYLDPIQTKRVGKNSKGHDDFGNVVMTKETFIRYHKNFGNPTNKYPITLANLLQSAEQTQATNLGTEMGL